MDRQVVKSPNAPAAVGPYSHAIRCGEMVYTAGQLGLDPQTGTLVEGGVQAQTRQVLQNLQAVLETAGTGLSNVVKTTVFLKNMGDFRDMNQVYAEFFTADAPARSTVEVAGLPLGGLVEIEAVAVIR